MVRIVSISIALLCVILNAQNGLGQGEIPTQKIDTQPRFVYVNEKSSYVAVALSGLIGFGLGDFYADDYLVGTIGAVTEGIGLGLLIAGWVIADDDNDGVLERSEIKSYNLDGAEKTVLISGLVVSLGSRIIHMITGAHAADRYNKRLQNKFRYETQIDPIFLMRGDERLIGMRIPF